MPNWWPSNISYRNINWGENKPRLDELVQIMEAFNQQLENTSSGSGDNGSQVGIDEEESIANIDIDSQDGNGGGNGCKRPEDEMETKCIIAPLLNTIEVDTTGFIPNDLVHKRYFKNYLL